MRTQRLNQELGDTDKPFMSWVNFVPQLLKIIILLLELDIVLNDFAKERSFYKYIIKT